MSALAQYYEIHKGCKVLLTRMEAVRYLHGRNRELRDKIGERRQVWKQFNGKTAVVLNWNLTVGEVRVEGVGKIHITGVQIKKVLSKISDEKLELTYSSTIIA